MIDSQLSRPTSHPSSTMGIWLMSYFPMTWSTSCKGCSEVAT